jgi:hypothetical protein
MIRESSSESLLLSNAIGQENPYAIPLGSDGSWCGAIAVVYYASPDRRGEHPKQHLQTFTGIPQADAYNGLNALFDTARRRRRSRLLPGEARMLR